VIILSKEEIINETISNFRNECSKLTESEFIDKLHKHEELLIKCILDVVLKDN
jgi:hypothetical protein